MGVDVSAISRVLGIDVQEANFNKFTFHYG